MLLGLLMLINNQGGGEQKTGHVMLHAVLNMRCFKISKVHYKLTLVACLIKTLEENTALSLFYLKCMYFRCEEKMYFTNVAAFKYCFGGFVLI